MPGLPGAACSSVSRALWPSFHARACSRPPEPITRTLTGRECSGASGRLKARGRGDDVGMVEPGLNRHEWESEWQQLEEALHESPEEALPDARDLVERMLEERGALDDESVTVEGIDPELVSG